MCDPPFGCISLLRRVQLLLRGDHRNVPPRWKSTARPRRVVDRCPSCGVDLGSDTGGTRRIALSALERGRFFWECPQCGGRWEQGPGHSAAVVLGAGRVPAAARPAPRRPAD